MEKAVKLKKIEHERNQNGLMKVSERKGKRSGSSIIGYMEIQGLIQ